MDRETFIPNSFQVPNAFVDNFMAFLTPPEIAVLMYACRRIFGFGKRQDRISLSQFSSGIVTREGKRLDYGTGLDERTISKALKNLIRAGLMIQVEAARQDQTPAMYALQLEPALVDVQWLMERRAARGRLNADRTQKARSGKNGTGTSDAPVLVHPTTPTIYQTEKKGKPDNNTRGNFDQFSEEDGLSLLSENESFVREILSIGLQGDLPQKAIEHWKGRITAYGREKVFGYLRWAAGEGWSHAKAFNADLKSGLVARWEVVKSSQVIAKREEPKYTPREEPEYTPEQIYEALYGADDKEQPEFDPPPPPQQVETPATMLNKPETGTVRYAGDRGREFYLRGGAYSLSDFQTFDGMDWRLSTLEEVAAFIERENAGRKPNRHIRLGESGVTGCFCGNGGSMNEKQPSR